MAEELDRLKNTYWNNNGVTVTLKEFTDLLKDYEVQYIPTPKLKTRIIDTIKNNTQRVNDSDLSYPIIIINKEDGYWIADGMHRTQKAINQKEKFVKAKVIDYKDLPDRFKKVFN